LTTEPQLYTR